MSREAILDRERRWALPAALCSAAALILFTAGTLAAQDGPLSSSSTIEFLRGYDETKDTLLLSAILNMLALFAFAGPLLFLFRAVAARTERVRGGLVGIVIAGPVFLGLWSVVQWIVFSNAAADFVAPGGGAGIPVGEYAEDLVRDQGLYGVGQGLGFAGVIGFVFAVIYTSLWAMRVGLVTRFFGTFGMALGASVILLGAQVFSLFALMLWGFFLGLIIVGRAPGKRPPAWEAGAAVPWPKPGEPPPEPEPSLDAIEGDAVELSDNGTAENPNAARRDRAKRRKRKRRR
jgi:hypothetical protein